MNKKKPWIILASVFALIISIILLTEHIAYTSTKITCGKIVSQSSIRGAWSVYYTFEVDGIQEEGGIGTSSIKNLSLDSLKKIDCIKIEYSNYSTFFNRVIDKRVIK